MGRPRYNAASLKHKEDHFIAPEDIIIDEAFNYRFEPHTEADVIERAKDMLVNGQIQPVGVRKDHSAEGRPKLSFGFLRAKAALWLNAVALPAGGVDINGTFVPMEQQFMLWAAPSEGNDLEAAKKNIIENLSRKGTTVMDMVANQDRLRKQNVPDEEIARLYRTDVANVRRYEKLLSLSRQNQVYIHRGVLTAESGFLLLELPEKEQNELVQAELAKVGGIRLDTSEQEYLHHVPGSDSAHPEFRTRSEGTAVVAAASTGKSGKGPKVSTAAIRKAKRKSKQEKGEKGPALSFSEFKVSVENLDVPNEDEIIREFARRTLEYIRGDATLKQWENSIRKVRNTPPVK